MERYLQPCCLDTLAMNQPKSDKAKYTETTTVGDDDDSIISVNETRVWLLKVPQFLFEKWTEIPDPNVDLGSVVINEYFSHNLTSSSTTSTTTTKPNETPKVKNLINACLSICLDISIAQ